MNVTSHPRILVLGDVMLDRYTHGTVRRASPEAPVLVLDAEREEARLGGAGAVAALVASLGAAPIVAGIVGDDQAGQVVRELLEGQGRSCRARSCGLQADQETRGHGDTGSFEADVPPTSPCPRVAVSPCLSAVLCAPQRPTTVKERLIGCAHGRHGQQLLRVDRESCRPIAGELEDNLLAAAIAALDEVRCILISDYGKGVCTPKIVGTLIAAAHQRGLPVLVDPGRGADYLLYRGATVIKPNRHEAGEATGREIRSRADAFAAGRELCRRWGFQAATITLDSDGLVLVTADGNERHFAAHDREVADVTGAGDTVLAVLGAALARGIVLAEACQLAVAAAGLQVERLGVSPVFWQEIDSVGNAFRAVPPSATSGDTETRGHGDTGSLTGNDTSTSPCPLVSSPPCRASSLKTLVNQLALERAQGRRIVFTNGCFDLLHAGHLHCLTAAKALGDVLVVAVNSDAGVRRLKGDARPIVCQRDRAALLAALKCVDYVTVFRDDAPERLIAQLRPDVLVKGDELRPAGIPGEAIVRSYGGRVALIPHLPDRSTTTVVAEVVKKKAEGKRQKAEKRNGFKALSPKP